MNSKQKGEVSEYSVVAELLKKGYKVSKPFGDSCPYDIIVENSKGKLLKIQVKSLRYKKYYGTVRLERIRTNSKKYIVKGYSKLEVDYFLIYCLELNKVYVIKNNEKQKNFSLRFEKAKNKMERAIRYAKDYELGTIELN